MESMSFCRLSTSEWKSKSSGTYMNSREIQGNESLKVYFFTPKVDSNDPIFGHSLDWIREISGQAESLKVLAVHFLSTSKDVDPKIDIEEIGGGNFAKRFRGIVKLIRIGFEIFQSRKKQSVVIYHMIKEPGIVLGLPLKLFRVRQVLWYSHSSNSLGLNMVNAFVDQVFTPTQDSYPIASKKMRVVGHGINSQLFHLSAKASEDSREGIISVGRISKIKRLEILIRAMTDINEKVNLIGPIFDRDYYNKLVNLSANLNVDVTFSGVKAYESMPSFFLSSKICYTGSPRTLDKSAIQAAMCGCFVVSEENSVLYSIGMSEIWTSLGFMTPPNLKIQIKVLCQIQDLEEEQLRRKLAVISTSRHSLDNLIKEILFSN